MPIHAHFEELPVDPQRPRAPRKQLLLEAEGAIASGGSARVLIHNVSATGLLIETGVPMIEAERIEIALPQIGNVVAHVVWRSETFYGCRFDVQVPASVLSSLELQSRAAATAPSGDPGDTLPVRIARLRKQQGLTLEALAELLSVSKPTVWAWEQGKARPAPDRIAALADRLGVAKEDLMTGRNSDAINDAISQARQIVGKAYGVDPAKVKVMIEL